LIRLGVLTIKALATNIGLGDLPKMVEKRKIHVQVPQKINERVEQAKKETGLTKSEIMRDGLLKKLRELGQ